jgi:hypothetical protein
VGKHPKALGQEGGISRPLVQIRQSRNAKKLISIPRIEERIIVSVTGKQQYAMRNKIAARPRIPVNGDF